MDPRPARHSVSEGGVSRSSPGDDNFRIDMIKKKQTVLLALSGGVDSGLAASLLKERGYEVLAAFMKIWSDTKNVQGECAWKEERRDALRVAAMLGIPFTTFDFEKEYREGVAEYLFREYEAGRTPNPDVRCNSEVKFPLLWREAKKLGADLIATGHHVRKSQSSDGKYLLLSGKDSNKDQSYFLHRLTQDDLSHTLFPIGEFTKEEVRKMARERGIPTADKRSTRGICFVGKVSLPEFLAQAVASKPGPIKMRNGTVISQHTGLAPYTIGQRHGFGVGGSEALYVVEKDVKTNTLVVGLETDPALNRSEIDVRDVYWISSSPPADLKCQVRIRYRADLVEAKLSRVNETRYHVLASVPLRSAAAGQFAVFYKGDECLGGGVIE